jgi:hypothetical protein
VTEFSAHIVDAAEPGEAPFLLLFVDGVPMIGFDAKVSVEVGEKILTQAAILEAIERDGPPYPIMRARN